MVNQAALIEHEICSRTDLFVGNLLSSFTFLTRERRALNGRSLGSHVYNPPLGPAMAACNGAAGLCRLEAALYLDACFNGGGGFRTCWKAVMEETENEHHR